MERPLLPLLPVALLTIAAPIAAGQDSAQPRFENGEAQVVVEGTSVFVGMEEFPATDRMQAMSIQAGTPLPVEPGGAWVLYDIGGKRVSQGEGPAPMPDLPGWTRLETGTDGHPGGRWLWVRR